MVEARPDRRGNSVEHQVAMSMGAPLSLAPVLGELYEGVSALGSVPRVVARMLRAAGFRSSWNVLDVGCGRGAVACAIASMMRGGRGSVLGVDAYKPFIYAARDEAERRGLGRSCTFLVGDARRLRQRLRGRQYDAASMLNLWDCSLATALLRGLVRPGGVYIVDDAYRAEAEDHRFDGVPTLAEYREMIQEHGDRVDAEWSPRPADVRRRNAMMLKLISRNARMIERRRPSLRAPIQRYLDSFAVSSAMEAGPLRPCVWLVRRA